MPASRLSKVVVPKVSGNSLAGDVITKLAGLDMVSPIDNMAEGRTPDAHDFRLYKESIGNRQVAVTTRMGSGFYTTPVGEALNASQTSSTGAGSTAVGVNSNIQIQPFTAASAGRLTRLDLNGSIGSSNSPLRIDIYDDLGGNPNRMITRSSIISLGNTPSWQTARFVNAPNLTNGAQYWIVVYLQDDGTGFANLTTTTTGTKARTGAGILGSTVTTYSLLYRTYTSPSQRPLGSYRFNRDNGVNQTLVAYGTTMYVIDETNHILTPLLTGLSASATEYSFTNADGKVFWVNGNDTLTAWGGSFESSFTNMVNNYTFATDTSGWTPMANTTMTRSTAQYNTAPASLSNTAASGNRGATFTVALSKDKRYHIKVYYRGAATAGTFNIQGVGPNEDVTTARPMTTSWQLLDIYYAPTADVTALNFYGTADFFIDDVSINDSGIEYVRDPDLPILKEITFFKDRMFGVSASDKNRLVFSENPGNPSNVAANLQWYHAWLSVSFIYVPRPNNGSPITGIIPFQDNLTIFTQDSKYTLSGSDRGSYFLREATGAQGALSRRGITSDPNFIYFVSDDGIYSYNGSKDTKISKMIQPLFDNCPSKNKITLVLWKSDLRAYMNSEFSGENDITAIYSTDFSEWMLDTDTYVERALYYSDADDNMQLAELSSQTATLYFAETDFNSLGAPIDFDYGLKYDSRGIPGQKKKFRRYVPLVQAVGKSFPITYANDRDFEDAPTEREQQLVVSGTKIGNFNVGDGTILTGTTAFKPRKTPISGYSYYMQFRVKRDAVNNQVAFMGVQFTYKAKKL